VADVSDTEAQHREARVEEATAGVSDVGNVTAYDDTTATVTVTMSSGTVLLRHTLATIHGYSDPGEFSPGACRAIAKKWNTFVTEQRDESSFRTLLGRMALHACGIGFTRSDLPNVDGTFDLLETEPIPLPSRGVGAAAELKEMGAPPI
jgi:hypothetical protein